MKQETCNNLWQCRDIVFNVNERTLIMGILNVTPDSFSDGGKFSSAEAALDRALCMQKEGADIIDVGGESTRPGSDPLSEQQELKRVIPVIELLAKHLSVPISVDTYKSTIASSAIKAGASIINDISGCRFDKNMPGVAASSKAGLVLMHIKGEPNNMQINPHYNHLMRELYDYLHHSINITLSAGVKSEQIVIDPGIGFGKRLKDNYHILKDLAYFKKLNRPILIGPSRKSFIGAVLNLPPEERIEGTIAAVTAGIMNGAGIVRVHDVKEIKRAVSVIDAVVGKKRL